MNDLIQIVKMAEKAAKRESIQYNEDFIPINLEEVPAEDLYEDGELNQRQVEEKIIDDWYEGRIILMRRRVNDKQTG